MASCGSQPQGRVLDRGAPARPLSHPGACARHDRSRRREPRANRVGRIGHRCRRGRPHRTDVDLTGGTSLQRHAVDRIRVGAGTAGIIDRRGGHPPGDHGERIACAQRRRRQRGRPPGAGRRRWPIHGDRARAGRFTVTGLVPDDYELRVTLPPALAGGSWTLGSIRQRGRDLRDAPLTFADDPSRAWRSR